MMVGRGKQAAGMTRSSSNLFLHLLGLRRDAEVVQDSILAVYASCRELEIRDPSKDEVLSHRCNENGDDGSDRERFGNGFNEWACCSQRTMRVQGTLRLERGHDGN